MLPSLLLLAASFPALHPRAPWKPDPTLPRRKVEWTALLRNPEIRFLTENQLSLTLDKSPGIARIHYYPVRLRAEMKDKLDYGILSKQTQLQGASARLRFPIPLRESSYEWLPDKVVRTWEGEGRKVREEITVDGNRAAVRLTRLEGPPFEVRVEGDAAHHFPSGVSLVTRAGGATLNSTLTFVTVVGYEPETVAAEYARASQSPQSVFDAAHETWDQYFTAVVPRLATANPALDRLYYYLFYVVRSSLFDIPFEPYQFPYTCPWKTGAIWQWTWNTPMNAVTERWLNDSSLAKAGMRLIAANNGAMYFGTYLHPFRPASPRSIFDWYLEMDAAQKSLDGKDDRFLATMPYTVPNSFLGVREVYRMTGDRAFLEENIPLMADYESQARRRAPAGSVLTPFQMMVDEYDYSLRWKPVQKTFTKGGLQRAFDLPVEMVDVNSYLYTLREILADAYRLQGKTAAAREMDQLAARTAREINARFWDPARNFYCDTRSDNHASTGVRAISGFVPLYAGIAGPAQRAKLLAALDDPKQFAAPYPVPSIEMSHPDLDPAMATYGGDSLITTGVWVVVNALAAQGEQARATRYLARTVEMMTRDGVSSSYTYNSLTGTPNQAKHTLATQSAIVNDLIGRYVVGLSPAADGTVEFHPFAANIAGGRLHFGPFRYRDRHWIEVEQSGSDWTVRIDGKPSAVRTSAPVRLRMDGSLIPAK